MEHFLILLVSFLGVIDIDEICKLISLGIVLTLWLVKNKLLVGVRKRLYRFFSQEGCHIFVVGSFLLLWDRHIGNGQIVSNQVFMTGVNVRQTLKQLISLPLLLGVFREGRVTYFRWHHSIKLALACIEDGHHSVKRLFGGGLKRLNDILILLVPCKFSNSLLPVLF